MLDRELEAHARTGDADGPVFFDRGVPDVVGYLTLCGLPVPAHMERAAQHIRYDRRVFIAPLWPEIFGQDAERKQDLDEARRTFDAMAETYPRFGYELIELPKAPVAERLDFMLTTLTAA
ncbi:hypothetical protein D3C73_1171810 [compost metagenome]